MEIQRFYLGCLAHASYLVSSAGEAAVVDPQRDVDLYLDAARERGLRIRWIIETHLHADFVSGHVELARRTGATICLGVGSGAAFPHHAVTDGDVLALGDGILRILSTPGHTVESICIVAIPRQGADPVAVLTGDTLFIGDVGRPDLSPDHTPQQLAGLLYDSLHTKLMVLPDATVVYPAHGAGSLCGKSLSTDSESTIGRERVRNYALQPRSREEFVDLLTGDLPPRPAYFGHEVERNRAGAVPLDELQPLQALSPRAVHGFGPEVYLLDTRPALEFGCAHIPGSVNIGLSGQFASWSARLLGVDARVVIVAPDTEAAHEARRRLARVGIENVEGSLEGGIQAWIKAGLPVTYVPQVAADELDQWRRDRPAEITVLDVREPAERADGYFDPSLNIPLGQLPARVGELSRTRYTFVHCKGGYRSSCATSLLRRAGFDKAVNVTGGYDAWRTFAASHL